MSEHVTLEAEDGHKLDAYVAIPAGAPIASLVLIHEAFGVNAHIRSVADSYAKEGFFTVAPALFDRVQPGAEFGYEGEEVRKAMTIARSINMEHALNDTAAALGYTREQIGKRTGVIGYCLGGSVAWLAACRLRVDAAVGYYGSLVTKHLDEFPRCPVMLHFGKLDTHIPLEEVAKIQIAHPDVQVYLYEANHGFNCDVRSAYEPVSAKLARERSLKFLRENLA
jgi:carboxymethylenebutenolidase